MLNTSANFVQVAEGSTVEDDDGARTATLLFKPGTTVTVVDENNNTVVRVCNLP